MQNNIYQELRKGFARFLMVGLGEGVADGLRVAVGRRCASFVAVTDGKSWEGVVVGLLMGFVVPHPIRVTRIMELIIKRGKVVIRFIQSSADQTLCRYSFSDSKLSDSRVFTVSPYS
jgi:hypothetical protein